MEPIDWKLVKVLVVDDDALIRKTMVKFFDIIGCVGAYAENGLEAIKLLKRYNFDMCFMDLFMPEMGGVEATQIIHESIAPKLPIIALTSSSIQADKDKCADIGMQDFIQKPVNVEMIKDVIRQYGVKNEI